MKLLRKFLNCSIAQSWPTLCDLVDCSMPDYLSPGVCSDSRPLSQCSQFLHASYRWPDNSCVNQQLLLLSSPSSLCGLHDRPMNQRLNQRQDVEIRHTSLFGKPADQEDGRVMSQKNHLIGVWMPGPFIDPEIEASRIEREGQWGSKAKRAISLAKHLWKRPVFGRDVLISCILQPCTGGQGQIIYELNKPTLTGRGAGSFEVCHLCMIIITATKSKSKKQFQHEVRIGSSLQQLLLTWQQTHVCIWLVWLIWLP